MLAKLLRKDRICGGAYNANSPLGFEAKEYIKNNFLIEYQNKDIIIGYRADDSYFSFAQDFINGGRSYRQLGNAPWKIRRTDF